MSGVVENIVILTYCNYKVFLFAAHPITPDDVQALKVNWLKIATAMQQLPPPCGPPSTVFCESKIENLLLCVPSL